MNREMNREMNKMNRDKIDEQREKRERRESLWERVRGWANNETDGGGEGRSSEDGQFLIRLVCYVLTAKSTFFSPSCLCHVTITKYHPMDMIPT